MFRYLLTVVIVITGGMGLPLQVHAESASRMLNRVDQYRLRLPEAKVVTLVKLYKDNTLDKTRLYWVYTHPKRKSLVLFKSNVEDGQKLLMLSDDFWLLMPNSHRPIRITPMQKLLGSASIGDIATLNWSEQYTANYTGMSNIDVYGQSLVEAKLVLNAKNKAVTYKKITLWVDPQTDFPIRADLYLQSQKLAKQAFFYPDNKEHPNKIVSMTLLDRIRPNIKTVIEYQKVTPYHLDDKYYNPAYLIRQSRVDE